VHAAVRKAENRDQFLKLLTGATDINFRLLSGEEEAFYAFKAATYSLNIHEGIIVDIGGGSTEIIFFKDNSMINSISIPVGAVVATEKNQENLSRLEDSI